jgi:hypothetical protein
MFGSFRRAVSMQTRRPKERPKQFPLTLHMKDGGELTVNVPADEYPTNILLFDYPPARILRGLEDAAVVDEAVMWMWWDDDKLQAIANHLEGVVDRISFGEANPHIFSRMLAKIGHAHVVAELGLDGFQHHATDFILTGTEGINYRVGGQVPHSHIEAMPTALFQLSHVEHQAGTIVALVRLFSSLNAPLFHIAVGLKEGGEIFPAFQDWRQREEVELPFPGLKVTPKPPVPRI